MTMSNFMNINIKIKFNNLFHLVKISPWPLFISICLWFFLLNFVDIIYKHSVDVNMDFNIFIASIIIIIIFIVWFKVDIKYEDIRYEDIIYELGVDINMDNIFIAFVIIIIIIFLWFEDIIKEAKYELNKHTFKVNNGLIIGFILFIVSEVFLFVAFFWFFFHNSLTPSTVIYNEWQFLDNKIVELNLILLQIYNLTYNVDFILLVAFFWFFLYNNLTLSIMNNAYVFLNSKIINSQLDVIFSIGDDFINFLGINVPLYNTLILLSSAVFLTGAHNHVIFINYFIKVKNIYHRKYAIFYLVFTINLGFYFLYNQFVEYINTLFYFSDNVYSTAFYSLTGLHIFHVIVGFIFLFICFIRLYKYNNFNYNKHIGFIASIWYWHFVDVVWIFLFFILYIWAS
jgi:heme/copper-type cytochrome/quinol oxidase subunit 3